jgi:hypothetical protein
MREIRSIVEEGSLGLQRRSCSAADSYCIPGPKRYDTFHFCGAGAGSVEGELQVLIFQD